MDSRKVYLAGPLFTQAERQWNLEFSRALEVLGFQMLVPQQMAADRIAETGGFNPSELFNVALSGVRLADALVAVLDGPDVDSGTAFECGIAHGLGRPVIGIRTDLRQGGDGKAGVNLMLSESCAEVVVASSLQFSTVPEVAALVGIALKKMWKTNQGAT